MTLNRPEPTADLREKVFEVAEGISDETQIFWSDAGAVILAGRTLVEVFEDSLSETGYFVQYQPLTGDWEELEAPEV